MRQQKKIELDFIIDKLTNSIKNVISGDSFQTDVILISKDDLMTIGKNNAWMFDWEYEYMQPERDVYKLTIVNNQKIVQGLISLEIKEDHVFIHLLESAPFNKGKIKLYSGVPGNLVAFACKLSFQRGNDGNVAFISKSRLIDHYKKSLGAIHFGGRLMIVEKEAALILINKYFEKGNV